MIRPRLTRRLLATVILPVLVAGAAACGDDDESEPSGGGETTPSQDFTGKPVTIFTSAPIDTELADVPELPAAVKAAARAINERGGLNGHEVEVEVCNDTDPNAEVACARRAAKANALAFSGAVFILNPAATGKVIEEAQIPSVANLSLQTVELANPINFAIDAPGLAFLPCQPLAPEVSGKARIVTIAQNLPNQLASVKLIATAAEQSGADYGGDVVVPVQQTDYSSPVQELSDKGAEIVTTQLAPTALPALVSAATSIGEQFTYCSSSSNVPIQVLGQLGAAASDYYVGTAFPPVNATDEYPLLQEFQDEMAAQQESGDDGADLTTGIPSNALRGWLGMRIIEQAAEGVEGELNNETLLAALNEAKVDLGGVVPDLDFSKPNPAKGFERYFNTEMTLIKWDPDEGAYVETDAEPVDTLELLGQ